MSFEATIEDETMGFHVNNTGFISGDGTRRYTPHRRTTSGSGKLSAQAERMLTDEVQRQLNGDDADDMQPVSSALVPGGLVDDVTANSATDAPLKSRGLVDRVQAQEQDTSKAKPKTNTRHDEQPLKPRGLVQ
ncbi:hypothetical protein [Natronospira bacteriovora]|uniref:Uncharacterized protein n=1 Tax=Natronospira bacteriovora TaxID=3069753 RepID=A0ABU0W510_9GAMM|nr:hypothetical protein [Natronospira sp. AB-CW4]MDQ2069062.1 hypothetical protein [Natronospira sp. AB-CW4]